MTQERIYLFDTTLRSLFDRSRWAARTNKRKNQPSRYRAFQ
jgi:hypothetical protein